MALTLPYNHLQWIQVVPGDGETFIRYNIKRDGERLVRPTVQVDALNTITTVEFKDFLATPNVQHEYTLTWTADIGGGIVVESSPSTLQATLAYMPLTIHNVNDPSEYVILNANQYNLTPHQEQQWRRARGNDEQTVFIGQGFWRSIEFNDRITLFDSSGRSKWRTIEDLFKAQRDGTLLCARPGLQGERLIGVFTTQGRQDVPNMFNTSYAFQEVNYVETT